MRSIGIFSGTFNPVHDGHIAFALKALEACHLDTVIFLPENSPRHKTELPDVEVRAARLRQAVSEWSNLDVLVLDQVRFTVRETLPELHRLFNDANFTLLLGSDVAHGLADWPDIGDLVDEMAFAIGLRKSDTTEECEDVRHRIESTTGTSVKVTYVQTDFSHLSSTQLR